MDLKDFNKPMVVQYWLGAPGQYNPQRTDLHLFPAGDNGGREVQLPSEVSPQQFFDWTMPLVTKLQNEAQKRLALDRTLHPYGILAQGVQVVWVFTSIQVGRLQAELLKAVQRIAALEERLAAIEPATQSKEEGN